MAETSRRLATFLYIIVPNYSAVVGIYLVNAYPILTDQFASDN